MGIIWVALRAAAAGIVLLALSSAPSSAASGDPCIDVFSSSFDDGEELRPDYSGLCHAGALNDTGIVVCGQAEVGNDPACGTASPLGQDPDYGRDAQAASGALLKFGGGDAGFDFSKVSNSGALLAADAVLGTGADDWACTRDNVTGLVWEVKIVDEADPRHYLQNYTWYDPASADGHAGDEGTTAYCRGSLGTNNCNTLNYAAAVNASALCGSTGWRLPTIGELESLVDFGRSSPAIDTAYFPNTSTTWHWSSNPKAELSPGSSWNVYFDDGTTTYGSRSSTMRVMLVRDAN